MNARTGERIQLFEVSTLYGAATLAAALDAGLFGPPDSGRRVLLVSQNAAVPETAGHLSDMAGWSRVAARFDQVVDWNETIRPHHPSGWHPSPNDSPVWERLLRLAWDLGDGPVELVVESVHVSPARTLCALFAEADIHVYADGLMSYGPTRDKLPPATACRVQRLLHLDLVPGLRPLLLSEFDVPAVLVPTAAFREVLRELSEGEELHHDPAPTAVLLGQYLAALGILSVAEEEELHARMVRGAAADGHEVLLFKPHPTAPASYSRVLEKAAADAGVQLTVLERPMLAETVFAQLRPRLVVGCFSTAMMTAAACYDIPVARVGTELLLDRLAPYQNSNRVPVTLVDALVPPVERGGALVTEDPGVGERVAPLVRTVGFCMQSERYPWLRTEAEHWLRERLDERTARYFKRRRLTALGLPGGFAPGPLRQLPGSGAALRAARKVRRKLR